MLDWRVGLAMRQHKAFDFDALIGQPRGHLVLWRFVRDLCSGNPQADAQPATAAAFMSVANPV
ncbi:hypothetical protein ACFQU2_05755 [Siccirubricoccus deserti]